MRTANMLITCAVATLVAGAPSLGSAEDEGAPSGLDGLGKYFLVGGGVTDFSGRALRDQLDVGGSWDARVGIGDRFYVGGELGYSGSYRGYKGSNSNLTTNGVEAIVRLQYPFSGGAWRVEPFAFGGIGWNHLSIRPSSAGLAAEDDVGVVPFGGGVTLGYGRWLLDARFTWRSTFNDRVALAPGVTSADLSSWTAGASIGAEF